MRTPSLALLACAVLVAAPARATPNFPPAIVSYLGASKTPPCRICHSNGTTGLNTVNTPFGKNLRARGALPYDEGSLIAALEALRLERTDSSGGRGSSDIDVLAAGGDPNSRTPFTDLEDPLYGCGASFGRRSPAFALLAALSLFLGLFGRRARGRK